MDSGNTSSSDGIARVLDARQDEILATVSDCIADVLDIPRAPVTPDATLFALGADSLHFANLVFRLEDAYGIDIEQRYAMPDIHTVRNFVEAVAAGLAARESTLDAGASGTL